MFQIIKRFLGISDKSYVFGLIRNFEEKCKQQEHHPFKIFDIREKGFLVKVYGLNAYVSFLHMPWKYNNISCWADTFPYLKGKIFYGRVFKFTKKPVSIFLNGDIPQFKTPELFEGVKYEGVVIYKLAYGLLVDIGYEFGWTCGSLVGLLHKANFENPQTLNEINTGELIEIIFWGYNENEKMIFGLNEEIREWITGSVTRFIGRIVPVHISTDEKGKVNLLVENKYYGKIPVSALLYPLHMAKVSRAISKLIDGDIIHCEIIDVNREKMKLVLKWYSMPEVESISLRYLKVKPETHQINRVKAKNENFSNFSEKLDLIGRFAKVEVQRKPDKYGRICTAYLVENKFTGKLAFTNNTYVISKKDAAQIENGLQDGEIIYCEVTGIEQGHILLNWNLAAEDLIRFLG